MKQEEVRKLRNGAYRIFWKSDGGESIASVGRDRAGRVWMAPANWISGPTFDWRRVEKVHLLVVSKT